MGRHSEGRKQKVVVQLTARVLVRTIGTVLLAVTEQTTLDTVAVTAGQESVLAERLVRDQQGLDFPLAVLALAVLDGVLPVARLLLDVEVQTGRASNGLQALNTKKDTSRD